MKTITVLERVLEEIKLIPTEKLPEILDIVHYFRIGLQFSSANSNRTANFAGCWRDMPDDLYSEFVTEITDRRQAAFSWRRDREARAD